jgi:MFS family permease
MTSSRAGAATREALGNPLIARLVAAYGGSTISEWAVWLAVLVYAQDRGGSALAGWVALGLLVPSIAVAPFVGRAVDGARPIRALLTVHAVEAVALTVAGTLAVAGAPALLLVVPAAVSIGGIAFVRPSYAAIAPGLVRSARELTSANLLAGVCDSASVLVGPLVATAFLALGGPQAVLFACAGLSVFGALATSRLVTHDRRTEVPDADEQPSLWGVVRSLRGHRDVPSLLAVLGAQHVLMGTVGVMFVVLAADELDLGGSGAGVLNMAFGVGAVCSGVGASLVVGRSRLAPVVVISLAVAIAAVLALGLGPSIPMALVALPVAGFARSLLDVTARILLQRSAPPQYLASVFAFIEVLTSVGLAVGTAFAQITVAVVGAPSGLVLLAAALAAVLVLTVRQVWASDRSADVPVVAIALLRRMPVFSPLPPAALEAVARAGVEHAYAAGDVVIREGDVGDSYYAISAGEVEVTQRGVHLRRMRRGDGVGEIALLADVPRSASVVAIEPTRVLAIPRESFLLAVTGNDASLSAAWGRIATFDGIDDVPLGRMTGGTTSPHPVAPESPD